MHTLVARPSIRRHWGWVLRLAKLSGSLSVKLSTLALIASVYGCGTSPTSPTSITGTVKLSVLDVNVEYEGCREAPCGNPETVTVVVSVQNGTAFHVTAVEYRINYRWTAHGTTLEYSSNGTLHVDVASGASQEARIVEKVPAAISQVNSIEVLSIR